LKNYEIEEKKSKIPMYAIIFIAYFFVNFHRYAGGISAPVLIEELHFTPNQIGWFGAIFTYCYAFANLPAGLLIDKFGSRKIIGFLYIGAAIGTLFLGMGTDFISIIIGRGLIAIGIAPVFVAACKVIAEWEDPKHFSTMTGYLMAFGRAGGIIAATPLVLLMAAIGWRNTYFIIALISFLIGIGSFILIRDKKSNSNETKKTKTSNPFKGFGTLVKQYQFWLVVVFMMTITSTAVNIFSNWGGVLLSQGMGYTSETTANVLLFAALASVFGAIISGQVVKKTSARFATMFGGCVLMLGAGTIGFFAPYLTLPIIYLVFILMGFVEFFTISTGFSLLRTIVTEKYVGTAIGTANFMMWGVGASIVAQLWGTWISDDYALGGFQTALIFHFIILVIGLIAIAFVKEKPIQAMLED
jgi:MFS family permease